MIFCTLEVSHWRAFLSTEMQYVRIYSLWDSTTEGHQLILEQTNFLQAKWPLVLVDHVSPSDMQRGASTLGLPKPTISSLVSAVLKDSSDSRLPPCMLITLVSSSNSSAVCLQTPLLPPPPDCPSNCCEGPPSPPLAHKLTVFFLTNPTLLLSSLHPLKQGSQTQITWGPLEAVSGWGWAASGIPQKKLF